MMACAPTINPPAPRPWSARNSTSSVIDCDAPESTEPARKITIANWNQPLRPYMSPSFPYSGVEIVEASR